MSSQSWNTIDHITGLSCSKSHLPIECSTLWFMVPSSIYKLQCRYNQFQCKNGVSCTFKTWVVIAGTGSHEKIWKGSTMIYVSNFPSLFFSLQPRPFSPPIHSSSPPPIAPLARAESTSSISSTNSLSAATTPTVGKRYLLSFNPLVVLTGYIYDLETLRPMFLVRIVLLCVLLLSSDSLPSQQRRQRAATRRINKRTWTPVLCRNYLMLFHTELFIKERKKSSHKVL